MLEHFMDERRVIEGIALRGGACLDILVLQPGTKVPGPDCCFVFPSDEEQQAGKPETLTLPYKEAVAYARAKGPDHLTVIAMTEDQASRFMSTRELADGEPLHHCPPASTPRRH